MLHAWCSASSWFMVLCCHSVLKPNESCLPQTETSYLMTSGPPPVMENFFNRSGCMMGTSDVGLKSGTHVKT